MGTVEGSLYYPPERGHAMSHRRRVRGLLLAIVTASAAAAAAEAERDAARVILPSGTVLRADVAKDEPSRSRGLMFRRETEFGPDQAMVFLFSELDAHSFWMKNMNFAIDILWLSPELRIVHAERNIPPCAKEPCPLYTPMQKAQVVVELHRGTIEREGLRFGDTLQIVPTDGSTLPEGAGQRDSSAPRR